MTKRSKFFRAARSDSKRFTSETKRTELTQHDLTQHDRLTFHLYLFALEEEDTVPELEVLYPEAVELHEKKLPCERTEEEKEQYLAIIEPFRQGRYKELVKLYILADDLEDSITANMVIDEIRKFMSEHACTPSTEVINLILNSTGEDDGLLLVFADFFVYHDSPRLDPELPMEFLFWSLKGTSR
jgi:hypothetical protein